MKPEPVYLLILNKAHTQEEFIRGSMTRNPYSSVDVGPLMRDVKNKICNQLDLIGLLEDDYGMELLVAGNIISLDLSISQVYEQVWRKHHGQTQYSLSNSSSLTAASSVRDCPPMTVTYRLQVRVKISLLFLLCSIYNSTVSTYLVARNLDTFFKNFSLAAKIS